MSVVCPCGIEREAACGCLRRELTAARPLVAKGPRPVAEYNAWCAAKQRTTHPNNPGFARYGGRGITMAAEWLHDFAAFFAHIGPKPDPSLTLDRIDNDRGYEPGNVRWATWTVQANNRRKRHASA